MADKMTIKCNYIPRDVLTYNELTEAEKKEIGDDVNLYDGNSFMRYKGWIYNLSEFMAITKVIAPHPQREGWEKFDGYHSDSFFSGILIRYVDDFEKVVAATYSC